MKLKEIAQAVAKFTNNTPTKIRGKDRKGMKTPRIMFCFIAYKHGYTHKEIGYFLGGRVESFSCQMVSQIGELTQEEIKFVQSQTETNESN